MRVFENIADIKTELPDVKNRLYVFNMYVMEKYHYIGNSLQNKSIIEYVMNCN